MRFQLKEKKQKQTFSLDNCDDKDFLLEQKNKIIDEYVYITTSDLAGKITSISKAYLDFTGYTKDEVIGKNHNIFRNKKMESAIIENLWDTILADKVWRGELKNYKKSGEEYWIKAMIAPLYDHKNQKVGYTSIKEDITDKKRLEELSITDSLTSIHNRRFFDHYLKRELKRSTFKKEKFALLIIELDYFEEYAEHYGNTLRDKVLVDVTNEMNRVVGPQVNDLFRINAHEFAAVIVDKNDVYVTKIANDLLRSVSALQIPHEKNKASDFVSVSIGAVNVDSYLHNINSNDLYNIAENNLHRAKKAGKNRVVFDVDDSYFKNLTNIDSITKLPNREALVNDISLLQDEAMLILLHINQIMALKDIFGMDMVKKIVAKKAHDVDEILKDGEASLYSLNLQEFAILVTNKSLFQKYLALLKYSILLDNIDEDVYKNSEDDYIVIDFTAGVAYGNLNIFNHADIVLQEAIIAKKSYKIYEKNQSSRQFQEATLNRMRVYKNALYTGNIIPYFQPIVDVKSGNVLKYEALARLQTDDGEIVTPYYFLDSAKEDKSFEYFTRQMMQKVFQVYEKTHMNLSMNLTYENISSESMMRYIKNRLDTYGGEGITFEIVESEDIIDYKVIEDFILFVKKYGCKISIDDFGSGYSNFTNVIKLNIDYIKLDGTLVEQLSSDKNVLHMVEGLLSFAKNANIKTIAEFVSTKAIAEKVEKMGIDYSQGYYFGEPKSAEEYGLI